VSTTVKPSIPDGYSVITKGRVSKKDLIWDIEKKRWFHPRDSDLYFDGYDADYYFYVARKDGYNPRPHAENCFDAHCKGGCIKNQCTYHLGLIEEKNGEYLYNHHVLFVCEGKSNPSSILDKIAKTMYESTPEKNDRGYYFNFDVFVKPIRSERITEEMYKSLNKLRIRL
jgi:hypothetical protein